LHRKTGDKIAGVTHARRWVFRATKKAGRWLPPGLLVIYWVEFT